MMGKFPAQNHLFPPKFSFPKFSTHFFSLIFPPKLIFFSSPVHDCQPNDTALMCLTSGSTGRSKFVMLSSYNVISRSAGSNQKNQFTKDDISLNFLPLTHVGSIIMLHIR